MHEGAWKFIRLQHEGRQIPAPPPGLLPIFLYLLVDVALIGYCRFPFGGLYE